jgi:pyruvyl transferase EpsO
MTMDELKAGLSAIRAHVPADRPMVYLDYPLHLNIGDLLIWLGAEAFFASHGYRITGRGTCVDLRRDLGRRITPETTIVLHGGGNFGDLYPIHQHFREHIVESYPANKLVLLPQTVHFESEAAALASAKIFNRHRDLTFFVRDEPSHAFVSRHFRAQVLVAPDMAHQLWGELGDLPEGSGALHLVRDDIEATTVRPAGFGQVDWLDLIPVWRRKLHRLVRMLHDLENTLDHGLGGADLWLRYCRTLCERMTAQFLTHRMIVTNRLHACILGALLEREVRFFDNSYGKLGAYTDAWMDGMPNVERLSPRPGMIS